MDSLSLDARSLAIPIDNAPHLGENYQYLLDSLTTKDPGAIYDHAKILLESIFRTIITNRNGFVDESTNDRATFMALYDQACSTLSSHETDSIFLPIVKKTIKLVGDMRNNYGVSSHGHDGYLERALRMEEALFVARMALSVSGYFYSRHINTGADNGNLRLHYSDNPNFNEYIDSEGDIEVAGIFVSPSRILFDNDPIAYKEKLLEYMNEAYLDEMEAAAESWIEMQGDIARGK